jgi:bifunctional DNA-binding transcriptional regulator/antitoxin component of YhaV-PrlF toxin-antitoxin module
LFRVLHVLILLRAVEGEVSFKTRLEWGGRVQVPKSVRLRFRLEPSQVLRVVVRPVNLHLGYEDFYGRIDKSGRITVPKLTLKMLEEENQSLTGAVMEVTIEPA